jgi:DNA-binding HxlR family transcriptional regulator
MEVRTIPKDTYQMESLVDVRTPDELARSGFENLRRVNVFSPDCPGHRVLDVIASKWTVLVLYAFNAAHHALLRIAAQTDGDYTKVLASVLRKLEVRRLICRTVYPTVPPTVEYFDSVRRKPASGSCRSLPVGGRSPGSIALTNEAGASPRLIRWWRPR